MNVKFGTREALAVLDTDRKLSTPLFPPDTKPHHPCHRAEFGIGNPSSDIVLAGSSPID
jgi:hypothetical protein